MQLAQLTEADWDNMAMNVKMLSQSWGEEELYQNIGGALADLGYTVPNAGSPAIIGGRTAHMPESFSVENALNYTPSAAAGEAVDLALGKKFWKRIEEKLKPVFCSNAALKAAAKDKNNLKEYLKILIPVILTGMGAAAINPILLALLCSVGALLLKMGFTKYCAA